MHADTAILAAIRLLPFIVVAVVVNVATGHLLSKVRYYMPMYLAAGVLITLGGSLLTAYLDPATSESAIYGYTVLIAFGTGLTIQLGYAVGTLTVTGPLNAASVDLQLAGDIEPPSAWWRLTHPLELLGLND